jgi:hypothetical protein
MWNGWFHMFYSSKISADQGPKKQKMYEMMTSLASAPCLQESLSQVFHQTTSGCGLFRMAQGELPKLTSGSSMFTDAW